MSEFLKNKYFFNEKSSSYNYIPEKDEFLKVKCPSLPEFLKNKYFVKGKSPINFLIFEK
jgi:hypothetical protein